MLGRLQLDALPRVRKVVDHPGGQLVPGLNGEFDLCRQFPQFLGQLQPAVRFRRGVQNDGHRAVIRDIADRSQERFRLSHAVDRQVPQLHKAPFREKRHGVHRILQIHRIHVRSVKAAEAEAVLPFRQADAFQTGQKGLAKIVLRTPKQIQALRAQLLEPPDPIAVSQGRLRFGSAAACFLCHSLTPDVSPPYRSDRCEKYHIRTPPADPGPPVSDGRRYYTPC